MKYFVASLILIFGLSSVATAEVRVQLANLHLCCGSCGKGLAKSVASMKAVKLEADEDAGTATLVADQKDGAVKALALIAAAGFHATVLTEGFSIPSAAPASEKVKHLTLVGAHNCCGTCAKDIRKTTQTVAGVTGNNVKGSAEEFTVDGDFDARELVLALEKAGFHVRVK